MDKTNKLVWNRIRNRHLNLPELSTTKEEMRYFMTLQIALLRIRCGKTSYSDSKYNGT